MAACVERLSHSSEASQYFWSLAKLQSGFGIKILEASKYMYLICVTLTFGKLWNRSKITSEIAELPHGLS